MNGKLLNQCDADLSLLWLWKSATERFLQLMNELALLNIREPFRV
jgi:hypothetical protein